MTITHFKLTNKTDKYYYFNITIIYKPGLFSSPVKKTYPMFREINGSQPKFLNTGQPIYELNLKISSAIDALLDSGIDEHNL